MHPFVAHKWACLALLWGFTTTLARPLDGDNLFALAPEAGDSPFTSDTLSIDGGSEPLFYDDYPQGATDISNLGGDPLLGFDQSVGSGFDVAYATGDCKLGEVVQNVGSVAFSGSCPPEWGSQGCGRTPEYVINFDDRLPNLCAAKNQKCCGGVSSAAFDVLTDCHDVPQPAASQNIFDYDVGKALQGGWGALINGNPGGSLSPGGANPIQNLLNIFGVGNGNKKKRSNDFCAAPPYS